MSPDTELIHWFLTIFSTDTVGVLRDTTKEDREKAIKSLGKTKSQVEQKERKNAVENSKFRRKKREEMT